MPKTIILITIFCLLGVYAFVVNAQQTWKSDMPVIVTKNGAGIVAESSRPSQKALLRIAKRNGVASIWVTLNVPYDPFLSDTDAELALAQEKMIAEEFSKVTGELVASGALRVPIGQTAINGPNHLFLADRKGLKALFRDARVAQVVLAGF